MLRTEIHSKRHRLSAMAAPIRHEPDQIVLCHPLVASAIGKVAVQLAAGYGHDAIPLAIRRASELFEQGSVAQFADWCLVIAALRYLESMDPTPVTIKPKH